MCRLLVCVCVCVVMSRRRVHYCSSQPHGGALSSKTPSQGGLGLRTILNFLVVFFTTTVAVPETETQRIGKKENKPNFRLLSAS